ncbi:response regulator transcription factor [Janthinobacterium lividum]|uniref:response regulator transcription factor n=1 Tax=Janthinobacterium TaxID=29580 RepID=UPI000874DB14|nr:MULTISPECIES: response regulator [Janthinobacterium]MBR7635307.1 response regulator transcription factor [Janthinobacterium lividum]OEZ49036.1 response regulator protein TodT [Janthinobacterium sp. MP5059B]PHV23473.1 DNA-binding response regulator [Janthinobacterium sp. BJB446]PHV51570.1 DNA-binding response regulator [Janthinobacterium sp. BJB301]
MNNTSAAAPCVFLVDDDPFILRALERILSCTSHQVQSFSSAEAFLAEADLQQAGCLVLDLSMPAMSGPLLQEHLLHCESLLPVIFLTGNGDVASSVKAMKLGAVDFLTKPVDALRLFDAVTLALKLNGRLTADRALLRSIELRLGRLTKREHQVMELVVAGRLNKQIAAELGTVEHTVKLHRASVMRKMQADSFSDLMTTINTLRLLKPQASGR